MAGRLGDGGVLRDWLDRAVPALAAARERIDAVNVFPVPDGDTGTNVLLTVRGAADEVAALPAGDDWATDGATDDGATVLRALARGALLSARGNSGVILSRYLGGLAGAASGALPDALAAAAAAARSAVPEPEDGTVLTVAAAVADAAGHAAARGAGDAAALDAGVAAGRADLGRISAAHPVLRSARVVDAGACALLVLLDALAAALAGRPAPVDVGWLDEHGTAGDPAREPAASTGAGPAGSGDGGAGGYEVVALLRADAGDGEGPAADAIAERVARDLAAALPAVGEAVAVVAGDGLVTAHVHAHAPAEVVTVLTAAGARWTASVRTLLGVERPVVACTGSGEAAAALAHAGAVAVLLPDGTPAADARDAVRRAVQDAQQPVHAAGLHDEAPTGGEPSPAVRVGAVTVLPGDRLDAADLDPGWPVAAGATDEAGVLAALAALV
ncbi:DAK2 domain-containing protein, partial [Cellulomonas sp. IC4_254]|uniref:DAK2 domain-containing protein n=1 Tax=Cellulomonas sp. IC4_254 TaxID=2714040 RepID=UPI0014216DDC|nr:DAK2 domain-containing protein [Cellulomonas sp. IC4_254]